MMTSLCPDLRPGESHPITSCTGHGKRIKPHWRHTKDITWEENNCIEANNYVTINKQVYFLGGDGLLMPQKKDQPPPFGQVAK
jgi:hypothetical protein